MRHFFSKTMLLLTGCFSFSLLVNAQERLDCESILAGLETGSIQDESYYDKCGFDDSALVWSKWAGYVSEKKMKRAVFEICVRYPEHEYHNLYCEKALLWGHPAAYIREGKLLIEKGDFQTGYEYLTKALATNELKNEEEAEILEILGLYYLKTNNSKSAAYLNLAAQKGSALAHNILGYSYFVKKDENLANEQLATEHFWHAILLGCKTAEENYGLFQLAKQSKIPVQKAEAEMRKNLNSCLPVVGEKKSIDDKLFNCRCGFSLEKEKQTLQKPYVLMRTEAKMAVLKDTQTGETMSVTEKRNLPNGANVLEVRKTAVILTYPSGEREILNLYKKDDCVDFCKQHNIQQNLSPTDMRLKIEGAKETVKIRPYHLTFTVPECDFISYYAQKLLPEGADYVGKEECKGLEPQEDAILTKVSAPEVEQIVQEPVQVEEKPIDALSISEKQRLIKASDDALKF